MGRRVFVPKSKVMRDSGGLLDFLSTVSGRKREVEVEYQPEALSFSLEEACITLSSFHSPNPSLHAEKIGVEKFKRGIQFQATTLFCCVA